MFWCKAGNIVVIRFQKSVTPPSQVAYAPWPKTIMTCRYESALTPPTRCFMFWCYYGQEVDIKQHSFHHRGMKLQICRNVTRDQKNMFRCKAGNIVVIRFQKSVTPPSQAVRNIVCNIFQFMLPHHTKPPAASWSKFCCRNLRALTKDNNDL